jgi:hypothetical protein
MPTEQDEKIELTPQQQNPYLARPEDFIVNTTQANQPPGHGQRGANRREEMFLLAKRKAQGKGVDLPTATDDAGEPHIGKRQ